MKPILQISIKFILSITFLLISLTGIKAQIVYTDLNPDSTLNIVKSGDGGRIPIDFNGDGITDIRFRYDKFGGTAIFLHITRGNNGLSPKIMLKGTTTNGSGVPWVDPLTNNADINSSKNWGYSVYGPLLSDPQDANFLNLGDRYIGVRFIISGKTHYGWICVSYTNLKLIVKGYAYERTPKKSIKAGDKGTINIADNHKKPNFSIFPNPSYGKFKINCKAGSKISVYSIMGQKVFESITTQETELIDLSLLNSGNYIVKISNSNIISTKKISILK